MSSTRRTACHYVAVTLVLALGVTHAPASHAQSSLTNFRAEAGVTVVEAPGAEGLDVDQRDVEQRDVEVPPLTGRVVDQAALLDPATERALNQQLAAHEDSTSNQVAVLTIASLAGRPIEEVALAVARTWQLGQAGRDNGVLLLVARDDRQMRIEVGYGLEGALPDVVASRIIRHELRPAFRAGDFDGGVQAGVAAILQAITGSYEPPPASSSSPPRLAGLLVVLVGGVVGGLPIYLSLMAAARGGWMLWILTLIFLSPFMFGGLLGAFVGLARVIAGSSPWGGMIPIVGLPVTFVGYLWQSIRLIRHPDLRASRKQVGEDQSVTETITVWPYTFTPTFWESGVASAGAGGSGSGFSSGGFSSGGSFSGGGGSFGGGGASGGW